MKSKHLLNGQRFDDESNITYKVPTNRLEKRQMDDSRLGVVDVIDFEASSTIEMIVDFIRHHQEKQVPRLEELKNYYDTNNNIKFRPPKPNNRADNRIASDFAKFDVEFKKGVIAGNPIEYTGKDKIIQRINEFSEQNNEDFHNGNMIVDALIYGRAYELTHRDEYFNEAVNKLDPRQTFVIYDTSMDEHSICGVRYFPITFNRQTDIHVEVYANDGFVYTYIAEKEDLDSLVLDERKQHYFDAVPVNEWQLNTERKSDYENILDNIDAYDLSQSEMANFMQDNSEALLVIKGNPDTFRKEDGSLDTDGLDYSVKNRFLVLGDRKIYEDAGRTTAGADPDAEYLVKEYDTQGVEAYNDRLVADILRFTHLIDFTDENMGGNQSGIGFRFKSWGSENDRVNKERMIEKALRRRLRLIAYSWSISETLNPKNFMERAKNFISYYPQEDRQQQLYEAVNEVEVKFTPNVPQSDVEIMNVISGMNGIVSKQTIYEMAKQLTGVDAEEEASRKDEEKEEQNPYSDSESQNHQAYLDKLLYGDQDEPSTEEDREAGADDGD